MIHYETGKLSKTCCPSCGSPEMMNTWQVPGIGVFPVLILHFGKMGNYNLFSGKEIILAILYSYPAVMYSWQGLWGRYTLEKRG
jgi:hypothetical protein